MLMQGQAFLRLLNLSTSSPKPNSSQLRDFAEPVTKQSEQEQKLFTSGSEQGQKLLCDRC